MRYRLTGSGTHWDVAGDDPVLESVRTRYSDYFAVILDPADYSDPDLRPLRDDLEHRPVDQRNFDALNAIAIGYFELNYRAESARGQGFDFLSGSFRTAQLLALPWRAYGEIEDGPLRDGLLDFFADAASGEKLASAATAPRLLGIVESLEAKEPDPQRLARIRRLAQRISAQISHEDRAP